MTNCMLHQKLNMDQINFTDYECLYFVGFNGYWQGDFHLSFPKFKYDTLFFPSYLCISGRFSLIAVHEKIQMPDTLKVDNAMTLLSCPKLKKLPPNIKCYGPVTLNKTGIKQKGFVKPVGLLSDCYIV